MHRYVGSLVVLAIMLSISSATAAEPSPLKITTKRDTDRAEVRARPDKSIISLHSPHGISQAVIHRTDETWPSPLILQLHLKGLEHLKVTSGKLMLQAAVSSHGDHQRVRQWKEGDEKSPLDASSPFWMEIRLIGKDGKPTSTIPLQDGYFEIQLLAALFEGNPKSVTVSWIDFYR